MVAWSVYRVLTVCSAQAGPGLRPAQGLVCSGSSLFNCVNVSGGHVRALRGQGLAGEEAARGSSSVALVCLGLSVWGQCGRDNPFPAA